MERGRLGLIVRADARRALASILTGLFVCAFGCASGPEPVPRQPIRTSRVTVSDGWLAMGTFFEADLRVPARRREDAVAWLGEARAEILRLEAIYSRHDTESELSRRNARQTLRPDRKRDDVDSTELSNLLALSEAMRLATNGAFDVAIDAPRVDLDAISKGAVLDRLRADFESRFEGSAALLDFGQSSLIAIGDPDGGGWRLRLQSRDPEHGTIGLVQLRDQALSMSSSLPRGANGRFEVAERGIVDPGSGKRVGSGHEAVVIGRSAAKADAWSTALLVLAADGRLAELEESLDVEWRVVDRGDDVARSEGWSGAARMAGEP